MSQYTTSKKLLNTLLQQHIFAQDSYSGQLHTAINRGDLDIVSELIRSKKIPVNGSELCNQPPIFTAIGNNKPEILKFLLTQGADANLESGGFTALGIAAINGRVDCVRLLLETGVDVNRITPNDEVHFTALHAIAYSIKTRELTEDKKACITLLLKQGANRNLKPENGLTAEELAPVIAEIARDPEASSTFHP